MTPVRRHSSLCFKLKLQCGKVPAAMHCRFRGEEFFRTDLRPWPGHTRLCDVLLVLVWCTGSRGGLLQVQAD